MTTEYVPFKAGTGTKVHAGMVIGEVTWENRKYGQQVGKIYTTVCTLVNTHNINKPVRGAMLQEGTPITCEHCLRKLAQREQAKA